MSARLNHFCLAAAVLAAARLPAQTQFDFESPGFDGWQQSGAAFQNARVNAATVFTTSKLVKIELRGGYWRDLPYPIGQHGEHLVSTILKPPHSTGTLTSPPIVLDKDHLVLSARIGGTRSAGTRFELQIGDRVVFSETGDDREALRQVTFAIPQGLAGRSQTACLRVVDDNPDGHINIDYIRFTSEKPAYATPVWGLGDIHTHLFSNLGFGYAKDIDVMWGKPGGAYVDYLKRDGRLDADRVGADLPQCVARHGGSFTTEAFINTAQQRHPDPKKPVIGFLQGKFTKHGRHGAPDFKDFPGFLSSVHQQMHVTQIHRAWEGGLRLLVQLGVNNKAVEYIASKIGPDGHISLTDDSRILKDQLEATYNLAALNKDWMEIADSPAKARDIIRRGKLAGN